MARHRDQPHACGKVFRGHLGRSRQAAVRDQGRRLGKSDEACEKQSAGGVRNQGGLQDDLKRRCRAASRAMGLVRHMIYACRRCCAPWLAEHGMRAGSDIAARGLRLLPRNDACLLGVLFAASGAPSVRPMRTSLRVAADFARRDSRRAYCADGILHDTGAGNDHQPRAGRLLVFVLAPPAKRGASPSLESGDSRSLERATVGSCRPARGAHCRGLPLVLRGPLPGGQYPRVLVSPSFVQDALRKEAS
jgi:hypothetical protein